MAQRAREQHGQIHEGDKAFPPAPGQSVAAFPRVEGGAGRGREGGEEGCRPSVARPSTLGCRLRGAIENEV